MQEVSGSIPLGSTISRLTTPEILHRPRLRETVETSGLVRRATAP